jgi:hypothetical protein
MAETTAISWCDSTLNPWLGCTKVGPGCDNCYAEAMMDRRMHKVKWGAGQPRVRTNEANWRQPIKWNASPFYECPTCHWRGAESDLLKTRPGYAPWCPACGLGLVAARRRVFCASLADVFDNEVDPQWRVDLFKLIAGTPNLDWLLLTKRIGNVASMPTRRIHEGGGEAQWRAHNRCLTEFRLGASAGLIGVAVYELIPETQKPSG